jgi:hypothetical protein
MGRLSQERPDRKLIVIDADLMPNEASLMSEMLAKTGLGSAENWRPSAQNGGIPSDARCQSAIREGLPSARLLQYLPVDRRQ